MKSIVLTIIVAGLLVLTSQAQAALQGRAPLTPGGTDYQAAYDTVLDITWVTDADLSGFNTWDNQVAWAANLNYLGLDGWRLASMSVAAGLPTGTTTSVISCGSATELACRDNELGYMFFQNMGGSLSDNKTGDQTVDGVLLTDVQSFYWPGTEFNSALAWVFGYSGGTQGPGVSKLNSDFYGWAVRPGDVGAVPVPAAVWLFVSALGLVGWRQRKAD